MAGELDVRRRVALGAAAALASALLGVVGLFVLRHAMVHYTYQDLLARQLSWAALGLLLASAVALCPAHLLSRTAYPLAIALALGLLLHLHWASHTWLRPSDVIVAGMLPCVSRLAAASRGRRPSWATWCGLGAFTLGVAVLFLLVGPAPALVWLVVASSGLSAMAWSGAQKGALAGVLGVAVGIQLSWLQPYQLARLRGWLSPVADARGAGWRILELRRLVKEGGWWGADAPWPARHGVNAFEAPYAFVGHQAGWLALGAVVLLNVVVTGVAAWIGIKASSLEARAIGRGVAGFWGVHLLLAAGGNLGLLPEVANTPPLIGYGGSAVVAALLSLGLLLHVLRRCDETLPGTGGSAG
ncbi:MAG: FtsW/RodA/SpoVE family cell cycle protein [Myxococcales bacterium]|nr:FtsW/RodA/SpoVE family cell cycle protein [Myxococcales bacterium]